MTSVETGGSGLLEGYGASTLLVPVRWFRQDDRALLHHYPSDANTRDYVPDPDTNWWACLRADQTIDTDALFDGYCEGCEQRWIGEGHSLWNPPQVSDDQLRAYARVINFFDFKYPSHAHRVVFNSSDDELAAKMLNEGDSQRTWGYPDRARDAYQIASALGSTEVAAAALSRLDSL